MFARINQSVLRLLLPALLLSALSCGSFSYRTQRLNMPVEPQAVDSLQVGVHGLADCLGRLGAPTVVETAEEGHLYALTWSWLHESGWDLRISGAIKDQ